MTATAMNVSHWARSRMPPSRVSAGFASSRKSRALAAPPARTTQRPAKPVEQPGDRAAATQVGGADAAVARPDRAHQRIGVVDRRGLLIPGVAIGQLAGQDALADVRVEPLVGAHRLRERRQAQQQQRRRPAPGGGASASRARSGWFIVLASLILARPRSIARRTLDRRAHLQRTGAPGRPGPRDFPQLRRRRRRRRARHRRRQLAGRHRRDRRRSCATVSHHVVHRAGKLGLGTAVVEGFEGASAPVVGVIDADLSHPPEMLPRMLAVMQRTSADIVIGSRYIPGGGTRNWPLSRRLMSRLACLGGAPADARWSTRPPGCS